MRNMGRSILARSGAGALALALVFFGSFALAAEPDLTGEQALLAKHASIRPRLDKNQFGAPIYIESTESEGSVRVDMYGVVRHPFPLVKDALQSPASWCDITPLHINIKACTYRTGVKPAQLTLYSGRKHYQPPSDAYPLKLKFHLLSPQARYLDLSLDADEGPLGTRDHRISLRAIPLDAQNSFIRFSYTYSHGAMARMAIKSYFGTIGRDKVGFSLVGAPGRKQRYVNGVRGAVERNSMRYYLALQTYLDTLKYPEEQRFEQRISRWYDLTAKYPRQLKEIDKNSYLANKRKEHAKQLALQKKEGM